ncbi:hypothetical protein THAOC_00755 [Thalassiosira oceanica]|uniref:Uncharacterized protein n=1 Tax=Thalassiosira oceanica TaxID=159749 RepID=K0TR97_THAOC|nr:hypothetical protein THAOC_00755 [Thalassiosira oceanica]|eukprot:EJK77417.1 hypothetical protein THAOC_00755 [Thalassiosira oceanica]
MKPLLAAAALAASLLDRASSTIIRQCFVYSSEAVNGNADLSIADWKIYSTCDVFGEGPPTTELLQGDASGTSIECTFSDASGDGSRVCFMEDLPGSRGTSIFLQAWPGGEVTEITDSEASGRHRNSFRCDLSRNGKALVFDSDEELFPDATVDNQEHVFNTDDEGATFRRLVPDAYSNGAEVTELAGAKAQVGCSADATASNYHPEPDVEVCCEWDDNDVPAAWGGVPVLISLHGNPEDMSGRVAFAGASIPAPQITGVSSAQVSATGKRDAIDEEYSAWCGAYVEQVRADVACALSIPSKYVAKGRGWLRRCRREWKETGIVVPLFLRFNPLGGKRGARAVASAANTLNEAAGKHKTANSQRRDPHVSGRHRRHAGGFKSTSKSVSAAAAGGFKSTSKSVSAAARRKLRPAQDEINNDSTAYTVAPPSGLRPSLPSFPRVPCNGTGKRRGQFRIRGPGVRRPPEPLRLRRRVSKGTTICRRWTDRPIGGRGLPPTNTPGDSDHIGSRAAEGEPERGRSVEKCWAVLSPR